MSLQSRLSALITAVGTDIKSLNTAVATKAPLSHTHTFQTAHTWAVAAPIAVASGQTDYIPPMRVPIRSSQTVKIARVEARLNNGAVGTTVSFKVQKNGADIAGFGTTASPLVTPATTAWAETDPTDVALADGDELSVMVTAIAGAPQNLSVSVVLEHTV